MAIYPQGKADPDIRIFEYFFVCESIESFSVSLTGSMKLRLLQQIYL